MASNLATRYLTPADVIDPQSFALYAQQTIGVPYPSSRDWPKLASVLKKTFDKHPGLTYEGLCRLVQWARGRHKRPAHCWLLVGFIRYAWQDGCLPELDPTEPRDGNTEYEIAWALEREEDPEWRRRLMIVQGVTERAAELRAWKQVRAARCASAPSV